MEKKQNVPALRFPEFSGEWKRKKLLDVLDINSGQDYKALGAGTIPVYGTGGYMLSVDRALSYEKDAIGIGRKGTIDNPFILKAPFWTVDTLFYAIPKEEYDLDFILGIFKNVDWRSKDESTGVPSLSKVAIGKTIAYIPFFMEQQKIGGFIARLNRQEQLFQNKIQKLQQFRQAMLTKLFPREGAAEPELRFHGFSGKWEQCAAKKIFESKDDRNHPDLPVLTATQEYGMVRRDRINYNVGHDKRNEVGYKRVLPGQFVIHLRSFQGGFAHSPLEGITSPAYTVMAFRDERKHDEYFWKYVFLSESFIKRLPTVTYGIRDGRSISFEDFGGLQLCFPSKEEQAKIGAVLRKIDSFISLQQKKLERMQRLKAALLEKLFV